MKIQAKQLSRGFTLIELLVAMAITTIIVTILISITALSLDTWNRSRSEIRASRQGKAMIDSMARDFESLVIRKGNDFQWLRAESNPPPEGPKETNSPNAVDLIFFSAATDRYNGQIGVTGVDEGGDVSTIGYQLKYQDPIDSDSTDEAFKTFVLYRKIVDPDETFEKLLGQEDLESAFSTLTGTGAEAVDAEQNFICENVYQFTVTFHVDVTIPDSASGTRKTVSVPVSVGQESSQSDEFVITGNGIETFYSGSIVSEEQLESGRVAAVEISLTVLTDFGLKQMQKRATIPNIDEFIAENSYQFSKLIPVPGS